MLTVIIPAYNVEDYIETCLHSVLEPACSHRDVHVIIVLDGPTDSTPERVQHTVKKYPQLHQIEVIYQNNKGLSSARNAGIVATNTEYVVFLDADDYWLPSYLDTILPELIRSGPDLLEYDAMLVDNAGTELYPLRCSSGVIDRTARVRKEAFLERFRCYAWSRVYRTRLFTARRFPAGRRFEDTATIPWLYWHAKSVISMPKPLIAYRQRPGSILASPSESDVYDIAAYAEEAATMFNETHSMYWRDVALRIFQQACSRIERLPASQWAKSIRIAKGKAVSGVPVPKSTLRWLQMKQTWIYLSLLFIKRHTIDNVAAFGRVCVHRFITRRST